MGLARLFFMVIRENRRIASLLGIAATAAAAFAALAILEGEHHLSKKDKKALKKIARQYGKHERAAELIHPLGKWYAYLPAAVAAGATIYAKGSGGQSKRAAGAAAPVIAAVIGALVNPLFDKVLPQPPTPPGRKAKPKPSFPSGHAFGLGAVALTTAYVLHREQIISPATAIPLALLPPLITGVARIIEKKHWPSEVAGGLLVAIVIASLSVLLYELQRAELLDVA